MRVLVLAALVVTAATVAFVIGRATAPTSVSDASSEASGRDVAGRTGDVFRVPSISLFCKVDSELNEPLLRCNHTGSRPRYQVRIHRNRTVIGRIGDPGDERIFPERP